MAKPGSLDSMLFSTVEDWVRELETDIAVMLGNAAAAGAALSPR